MSIRTADQFGIGERGVDLSVELVSRRILGRANAVPVARLIVWYELADGWEVRQRALRRSGSPSLPFQQLRTLREHPSRS
jgi:hypothetical protein